jgi:hypothetical protein
MSLMTIIAQTAGSAGGSAPPSDYYGVALVDNQIAEDDGPYNGFSMAAQAIDGRLYRFWKKAASHAAKGPFMCQRSTLVSGTFEKFQVSVGGVSIESAAHSWCQLPTGRFVIAYQDNELYTSLKLAYSDDPATGFTLIDTVDLGSGYSSSPSPIKMIVMPSGKARFYVYRYGSGANHAIIQDIIIPTTGDSWSWGATLMDHNSDYPASFGDWKGHEAGVCITHNTGVDATCKMIAIVRTALPADGGTYFMHRKSVDGGDTWTDDMTDDAGTFVDDNGTTQTGPFSRALFWSFLPSNSSC